MDHSNYELSCISNFQALSFSERIRHLLVQKEKIDRLLLTAQYDSFFPLSFSRSWFTNTCTPFPLLRFLHRHRENTCEGGHLNAKKGGCISIRSRVLALKYSHSILRIGTYLDYFHSKAIFFETLLEYPCILLLCQY